MELTKSLGKFKCVFLLCLFNILFSSVQSSKFFFYVPARTMKCMGEYLSENTVGNRNI